MKILSPSQYISERIKVKPITNAELEQVQKTVGNSVLTYENILKEGNVVMVREDARTTKKHIVMHKAKFNTIFMSRQKILEDVYVLCEWDSDVYWACVNFKDFFPEHINGHTRIVKIIDAGIDLENVNTKDELMEIFNKYRNIR